MRLILLRKLVLYRALATEQQALKRLCPGLRPALGSVRNGPPCKHKLCTYLLKVLKGVISQSSISRKQSTENHSTMTETSAQEDNHRHQQCPSQR